MTIGLYIILTNGLKADPDSKCLHMVVGGLNYYWMQHSIDRINRHWL